jgi:hypothetical protein
MRTQLQVNLGPQEVGEPHHRSGCSSTLRLWFYCLFWLGIYLKVPNLLVRCIWGP